MPKKDYLYEETRFMPQPETLRPVINHTPKAKEEKETVLYGNRLVNKKTLGRNSGRIGWIIK